MRRRRAAPHGEGVRSRAVALAPASGDETYEIIRRRLFQPLDADGEKARDVFSDLEMTGGAKPGTIVEFVSLRRRRRPQAPVARRSIGSHDRSVDLGGRRHLARPPGSREGVCAQQRRLWRRAQPGDGSSNRSPCRAGSGPAARSAGHLRSRPPQYAPQARARRGRRQPVGGDGTRPSTISRGGERCARLSPARDARVRTFRHDR